MTNQKGQNSKKEKSKLVDEISPVNNQLAADDDRKISLNYPKPVALSEVIAHVAEWSGFNFVMEPGLNKAIQIFAPHPLKKADAFNLFVASLETVGLRAVMLEGNVAKIVSHGLGKVAV